MELWNKGLTVNYTISSTAKDNITHQWEITNILSQDEVRLPCQLVTDEDQETQIHKALNVIKQLIEFN